ncbi:MAG TPA: metal-dependent transcriptional regulator [Solirubrobacteraceae bacterium]|nr:metal-dependent transcriptional regulator [Solirubrobacteraceae bacterium]
MATRELTRSPAIEDYCKAIFTLESRSEEPVATNPLAERLGLTPGSVSAMLKRLGELGLIEHHPYRGVRLTEAGRKVALEVIRHHRLLELFLAESLQMPWDRVHAEAEVLEHVISEELEQLIAERLGHPTIDPHGDPIPNAELELHELETLSLEHLQEGDAGVFVRVSDADPEMLRYLSTHGIAPGDRLRVRERQPFGGPVLVAFGEGEGAHEQAIGGRLAAAMRVQLDREDAMDGDPAVDGDPASEETRA